MPKRKNAIIGGAVSFLCAGSLCALGVLAPSKNVEASVATTKLIPTVTEPVVYNEGGHAYVYMPLTPENVEWVEEDPIERAEYAEAMSEWSYAVASAYNVETNYGTETASMIPFNDYNLTVASRTLELGSWIEIAYEDMVITAQVTDRGPYIEGRDLDLSQGCVNAFGFDSIWDWGVRTVSYRVVTE